MKNKIKNKLKTFFKCYLPGFILGIISACTISVIAATYFPSNQTTYDNTKTELKSENVQDAIDELYGVCFPPKAGDQIIENAGLEKDPYECRYFFTGANPNNYITFNNEQAGWRIISVECDGTIKIMRTATIGAQAWDSSNSNNWARPASLNTYLNETYYNGLNDVAKSQIVASNFSIGKVTDENNNMSTQVSEENSTLWNGKIALPTVSEYIRTNSNKSSCGSFSLINNVFSSCASTGWMDITSVSYWWTLSPVSGGNSSLVFAVLPYGTINYIYDAGYSDIAVRPALYLSSEVKITGGNGSQNNPYTLE